MALLLQAASQTQRIRNAENSAEMLIDRSDVLVILQRVVRSMSSGAVSEEDLMQEALIHLWQQESQYPSQSLSWYLQSCRFHLQHYLSRGRSVDSVKHRQDLRPKDVLDEIEVLEEQLSSDDTLLASVCAHDMLELLLRRVKPSERAILNYMAEGLGIREIAEKLHMSHQCVSRHHIQIAALAIRLGISPPPRRRPSQEDPRRRPH